MFKVLKLNEADEELENQAIDDLENQENADEIVDSEQNQEENPLDEETELDVQLNELRDVLIDLDLNLYQVINKEDTNDIIYIIGKVAEESNDVLMLVDTKPEEDELITDEPIEMEDDEEDIKEDATDTDVATIETNEEDENRFDFVKLPIKFEEINKLNPRYGTDITPDHQAIMDYLMNCLIEVNPERAEEIQNKDTMDNVADDIVNDIVGDEDLEMEYDFDEEE